MSSEKEKNAVQNAEESKKCEPGKLSISLKAGDKRSCGRVDEKKTLCINIGKKKSDSSEEISKKITVTKSNNECALKDLKGRAAEAFNNESDSEEEEMPLECRMKMRNMGRDTITSAGPNSFNKGKEGFSHNSFKKFELSMKPRNNKESKHIT
ncbi:PEST proteolytic signal-containing nuclear protein isoform X1 [Hydra vulgaris]|uniref:PEST proteolytic signal-containing nuclear protein n=1 Tax=Hydra vulgaris TaxID=6087 RepID=A0ABM4BKI6_HYDVU